MAVFFLVLRKISTTRKQKSACD